MKTIALVFALALAPLAASGAAVSDSRLNFEPATHAEPAVDASARKKARRHVHRGFRYSYGYDRPYIGGGYYYRGVRPGWGYGPDPGDYAWPPFHFKPYW